MARILIVDDEKPMRQFLVAAFEQEGHQVLQASHGRQALSMLAGTAAHPDIVISDVMMPLVGGVELCGVLKADPATADIPIVLMSAAHPAPALFHKPMQSLASRLTWTRWMRSSGVSCRIIDEQPEPRRSR